MAALIWAIFVGLLIGGGAGALAAYASATAPLLYLLAVGTGVLVGLVAGKPIWAEGARIEAGLKAVFGAAVGAGLLYALRSWVSVGLDLSLLKLGQGPIGTNPVLALPLVATALALLYEVDNMFGKSEPANGAKGKRIAQDRPAKARVAEPSEQQKSQADEPLRKGAKR